MARLVNYYTNIYQQEILSVGLLQNIVLRENSLQNYKIPFKLSNGAG